MVDPKQRKVIVVENPLMPTLVKEMVCKVLFSNLQVRPEETTRTSSQIIGPHTDRSVSHLPTGSLSIVFAFPPAESSGVREDHWPRHRVWPP